MEKTDDQYSKKAPWEIDEVRFDEMLNVLPPCRWQRGDHLEWFHMSERLSGNIVTWFGRVGRRYFEMQDEATLTRNELAVAFLKAAGVERTEDL